jgi:uncharacterized protein (TIGR03435 family)
VVAEIFSNSSANARRWRRDRSIRPDRRDVIFDAIEKDLGLKLEAQKRSYPVFVIDHIEEKPTEN